jgi:hypothetical protein
MWFRKTRRECIIPDVPLAPSPEPAIRQEQFAQVRSEDRLALQAQLVHLVKNELPIPHELLESLKVRVVERTPLGFVLKPDSYGCDDRIRQEALNACFVYQLEREK